VIDNLTHALAVWRKRGVNRELRGLEVSRLPSVQIETMERAICIEENVP
jgi:hypothetical protein